MSPKNVEIVEEVWRAFNRGDVEAMVDLMTDDVDLRPPSHRLDGIVFRGHLGLRAWMERVAETWTQVQGSPRVLVTAGERLVVATDVRVVGHDSGASVDQRAFTVFTMRGGKVAAVISYLSEREALEAAGVPE